MADPRSIISATAPPTIANLAVGFDLLGLAVQGEGDVVEINPGREPGLVIKSIEGDQGKLSRVPDENTASAGVLAMLRDLGKEDLAIELRLQKNMPLGSGMGSSASSAAAGVLAANAFLGEPFTKLELVKYALIGEAVASGAIHGDNVVPSLLGGLILMRRNEPADVIEIPFIDELQILLIHPHVEVMTQESRGRLRSQIAMSEHIRQSSDSSAFIHAMHKGDVALLRRCMNDHIIAPQRKEDIPRYDELREVLLDVGAINYDISGSGPSSFAFFEKEDEARAGMDRVRQFMTKAGIDCDVSLTQVDTQGARIL